MSRPVWPGVQSRWSACSRKLANHGAGRSASGRSPLYKRGSFSLREAMGRSRTVSAQPALPPSGSRSRWQEDLARPRATNGETVIRVACDTAHDTRTDMTNCRGASFPNDVRPRSKLREYESADPTELRKSGSGRFTVLRPTFLPCQNTCPDRVRNRNLGLGLNRFDIVQPA